MATLNGGAGTAAEGLEGSLAAARAAAAREGIAHGGPMGEFVGAIEALVRGLDGRLGEVAADMRRVAEADIERSRAAREMAEASARKAEAAARELKVETERVQTEVVGKLADRLGEDLKDVLVVVEKARRDRSLFGLLCAGAAVGLALFAGGYGLSAWRDREAVRMHAECLRGAAHDARGNLWCPMRAALADEDGRRT